MEEVAISMVCILVIWSIIAVMGSEPWLVVAAETVVMVMFMMLSILLGLLYGDHSELAIIAYIYVNQVWAIVLVIRMLSNERR